MLLIMKAYNYIRPKEIIRLNYIVISILYQYVYIIMYGYACA